MSDVSVPRYPIYPLDDYRAMIINAAYKYVEQEMLRSLPAMARLNLRAVIAETHEAGRVQGRLEERARMKEFLE